MKNTKPKKSAFLHGPISELNQSERIYYESLLMILQNKSPVKMIAVIPGYISRDDKERPLIVSREIVDKIERDHGPICPENMIVNANEWEFCTINVDNKPDRINLIKEIPGSNNFLVIAASQDNGFYLVTHFETESKNDTNLKRLLNRGNVLNGVSSVARTINQDLETDQSREVI